jgi:hypothetical protein
MGGILRTLTTRYYNGIPSSPPCSVQPTQSACPCKRIMCVSAVTFVWTEWMHYWTRHTQARWKESVEGWGRRVYKSMGLPPVATVWSYLSIPYRSSRPSKMSLKKLLLNAGTRVLTDRPTVIQFCRNLPNFTQRQRSLPWSQQPITRHF